MIGGAVCAIAAALSNTLPLSDHSSVAASFDWNALLQAIFFALSAYFGGRQGAKTGDSK